MVYKQMMCEKKKAINKENKIKNKRDRIKTNMYFRIFDDLVRFPKDIWHYLKNSKKE